METFKIEMEPPYFKFLIGDIIYWCAVMYCLISYVNLLQKMDKNK